MFDRILTGLHAVNGVQATLIIDARGELIAFQAHAVYDQALLQDASRQIMSAVDSVQLVQEDWELVTATYVEGKVLIRNLNAAEPESRASVLAVIADTTLNAPFAGVAIRVAASKIKAALNAPGAGEAAATPMMALASGPNISVPGATHGMNGAGRHAPTFAAASLPALPARAEPASSGQAWSALNSSIGAPAANLSVRDEEASGYLAVCSKALSRSVGPIARVFVREAVHRVCVNRPFSCEDGAALVAELVQHIRRPSDRNDFQKAMTHA